MSQTLAHYGAQAHYIRERLVDVSNLILTRWLFLRLLALIYLIAFLSFWSQCDALIGREGILPAAETLTQIQETADQTGKGFFYAMFNFPTLCWFGEGYVSPVLCLIGVLTSLVVMTGFAQPVGFFILWACYLSVTQVGWVLTDHVGDRLLLEAGFLAIFFSPFVIKERTNHEPQPSELILFLYRWLVFRVVLGAALAKFGSGDGLWYPSFGALAHYFQSQPLPTPLAWYFHHLPAGIHRIGTAALLGAEIMLPLLIFSPRKIRVYGAAGIIGLQVLIVCTGNYGIHNWVTIALAVLLFDDEILPLRWRGRWCVGDPLVRPRLLRSICKGVQICLCVAVVSVSLVGLIRQIEGAVRQDSQYILFRGPGPIIQLGGLLSAFGIVNGHAEPVHLANGRMALLVEGSDDKRNWKPYTFPYHHGPLDRAPPWIAPFHPRLDWQLSQAANGTLRDRRTQKWFLPLMLRILQGNETVLAKLDHNPFPDRPPRYLRAVVYRYEFTSGSERRTSGAWWRQSPVSIYCPPITAQQAESYLARLPGVDLEMPPPSPKRNRPRQSEPEERVMGPAARPKPGQVDADGFVVE